MTRAFNIDCMEAMREMEDNQFDLAIVDPPYAHTHSPNGIFSGGRSRGFHDEKKDWNKSIPDPEYFKLLYRVSKNQIIWGCNYFHPHITVPGRIVHDKKRPTKSGIWTDRLSPCDLASQSFNNIIDIYEYQWVGNIQNGKINWKNNGLDSRIHPTQKPVALYKWLLKNYAKEGDTILDTHLGSGSSRIAAYDMGFDFIGYEIDKDYFEAQEKRFTNHIQQQSLFEAKEMY